MRTILASPRLRPAQRRPGLLIPIYDVAGSIVTNQLRPDTPRTLNGKEAKYETPKGGRLVIDVPPVCRAKLGDPKSPLIITEGVRKADAAASVGVTAIDLLGVWGFRGRNGAGGRTVLPCWGSIALNGRSVFVCYDSDVTTKPEVALALRELKAFLESKKATVHIVTLPPGLNGEKVGLDDFLAAGNTAKDFFALASKTAPATVLPGLGKNKVPVTLLALELARDEADLFHHVENGAPVAYATLDVTDGRLDRSG